MTLACEEVQHPGNHVLIHGDVFGHDLAVNGIHDSIQNHAIDDFVRRSLLDQRANVFLKREADFLEDVQEDALPTTVELRLHKTFGKEILSLDCYFKKILSAAIPEFLLQADHWCLGFLVGEKIQSLNEPLKVFIVFAELLEFGQGTRDGCRIRRWKLDDVIGVVTHPKAPVNLRAPYVRFIHCFSWVVLLPAWTLP